MTTPTPPVLLGPLLAFIVRWRYRLPTLIPIGLFLLALTFGGSIIRAVAVLLLTIIAWASLVPQSGPPPAAKQRRGLCNTRFNPSKLPEDLDVIVVGSGLAGLSCAAVLARTGKRVVVLEQHDVAGGGTHEFVLGKGFRSACFAYSLSFFDSGLHYVPPWSQGLLQIVTGDAEPPVKFERLGEGANHDGCFDRVVLDDGTSLDIKADESHLEVLAREYPHQAAALRWFHHVAHVVIQRLSRMLSQYPIQQHSLPRTFHHLLLSLVMLSFPLFVISKGLPAFLARPFRWMFLGPWRRWGGRTSRSVMEEIFTDKKLQALICGQWQDTGTRPDTGTFWLTASVFRGLAMEGASYPRGGSAEIAKALVTCIERNNGQVLVRCPVEEICVEKGRVTGVQLTGKHPIKISCDTVVTNFNPQFASPTFVQFTGRVDYF